MRPHLHGVGGGGHGTGSSLSLDLLSGNHGTYSNPHVIPSGEGGVREGVGLVVREDVQESSASISLSSCSAIRTMNMNCS